MIVYEYDGAKPYWLIAVFIAVGTLYAVMRLVVYPNWNKPSSLSVTLHSFVALVVSGVWTWFLSAFVIDLLTLIGFITELPSAFLGVTLLSIGNSISDFIADVSIANLSYIDMAITGTYACPTFNMMLGFAISIVVAYARSE